MISSQDIIRPVLATTAAIAALLIGSRSGWCLPSYITRTKMKNTKKENNSKNEEQNSDDNSDEDDEKIDIDIDLSVLPCIRNRRSIFPNSYRKNPIKKIDKSIIQSLLDAALWSPFHGNCYKDSHHPAQFVILGKESMDEMQQLTLDYYDKNWKTVGWPGSSSSCTDDNNTEKEYRKWRTMTEDEITNRWKPVEYMIAIIMRRQSTPTKRFPEWEELAGKLFLESFNIYSSWLDGSFVRSFFPSNNETYPTKFVFISRSIIFVFFIFTFTQFLRRACSCCNSCTEYTYPGLYQISSTGLLLEFLACCGT